jgi:deoxyadenosine/deoxycytidine kinase
LRGKVKARQFSRECAKKPQDKEYVTALADIYEEWFDTWKEARQSLVEAKAA